MSDERCSTHGRVAVGGGDAGDAGADVGVLRQVAVAVGVDELRHEVVADDADGDVGVDGSEARRVTVVANRHHSLHSKPQLYACIYTPNHRCMYSHPCYPKPQLYAYIPQTTVVCRVLLPQTTDV